MSINISFLNTSNTMGDVIGGVNQSSGGFLIGALMLIFTAILTVGFKTFSDTKSSLIASGGIIGLIGVYLWAAGFIPMGYIFIPLVFLFAGLIMIAFE